MLTIESVQSFSFKMSVEHLGFPLPIKIEEDRKIIIDLDTEGNSPEDIVIEWHLEIRRFFSNYSEASGEITLTRMMKEYIASITERAIHFEDIVRLQELVDNHIEHIYWFYRDSDICFSDMYLDYMEHILTFYVNLTLRALLESKKKAKVTQKKVNDTTQKVIKRLSIYLLRSEYHIFHVLIRQTTTLVDGMIKDVMTILNSNICKHMFRNLYMHFLVLTPVRDMSEEAFCRAFILFENWKAFEDYKQNEKIEECMKNTFNRDMMSIRESEFLRKILMPQTSIMSELMKVMGCNPSITKTYFDYIKSKQKVDPEIIDDIGKLALEDALFLETELTDDDDDCETTYIKIFNKIMENVNYNLNDIVLNTRNCKNEDVSLVSGLTGINEEVEILISDTDSDSDVEIVSIVPSQNSSKQGLNTIKGKGNAVATAQTTSFLDSIEIDTYRKKYRSRTSGNFDNLSSKDLTETNKATKAPDNTHNPSISKDQGSCLEVIEDKSTEPSVHADKDPSITECELVESSSLEHVSTTDNIMPSHSKANSLIKNANNNHLHETVELEVSRSPVSEKKADSDLPEIAVPSTSNEIEKASQAVEDIPITQATPASDDSQVIIGNQTNGIVTHICRCSQFTTSVLSEKEPVISSDLFPTISSALKNVEVIAETNQENDGLGTAVNLKLNIQESSNTGDVRTNLNSTIKRVEVIAQDEPTFEDITENYGSGSEINPIQKVQEDNTTNFESTMENVKSCQEKAILDEIVENLSCTEKKKNVTQESTGDIITSEPMRVVNSCNLAETENILNTYSKETNDQATVEESLGNQNSNEVVHAVQITEDNPNQLAIMETKGRQQMENTESISLAIHMSALSLTSELTTNDISKLKNDCSKASLQENKSEMNCSHIKDFDECHMRDRTLKCDKKAEVLKCRTANHLDELIICDSGSEKDKIIPHCENNMSVHYVSSTANKEMHGSLEETTPLDTGQDHFVQPLDTGQFGANSPASPDNFEVNLKSLCHKREVKLLRTVSEPELRKTDHGEFGYPTPPGSEEERDKDLDEQTKLIYSNILPTQGFVVDETIGNEQDSHSHYEKLTSKKVQKQDFFPANTVDHNMTTTENELLERIHDKQLLDASPSLGKSYEQIVKDAIGSQNSTEDEEDETQIISRKYNKDEERDISFDDMKEFLKNCENEDYIQAYRKKRKRPREKTSLEDIRSRKNSFVKSSPKRVKINEKPETYFITSYDEDSKDDLWDKQNSNEYDSSSSSDNEMHSSRHGVKTKRRTSPMPHSKYMSKRNRTLIHIPLSERLSPDRPPPLKGILKQMELKQTNYPRNIEIDEPETVIIVLHQGEIGRGKKGSVEVKVYRKSFLTHEIPFDDDKLCYHHAVVKMEDFLSKTVDKKNKVSDRTRNFEEEMFSQPEKPMYKIVFDKKTPQLNSNDRKFFCDPSISANSNTLLENEQGTVNLSTEIAFLKSPERVELITEHDIQTPISPPCFSPSSNSSSEFSDPINLIPYQDIERALQVVEPDKPCENGPDYTLECHDSNDSIEKSLVDRIAIETIELLSNNADFHKMLKDLNGDVLIENVPWIGVNGTGNIGNVAVVPNAPSNDDDLVSNLNSDEQLLKKVCQELESNSLVDNLSNDPTSVVAESVLELNVRDNYSGETSSTVQMGEIEIDSAGVESEQICYQGENNIQFASFPKIPSDDVLLHGTISPKDNSTVTDYSETNYSVANNLSMTIRHSPPVTDSLHKDTFSSITNCSIHSGHSSVPVLNSPIFPSKPSSARSSPVATFHQESCSAHVPAKQISNNSEMNLSSNSVTVSRNSAILNLHQQTFSTISKLRCDYAEKSYTNASLLVGISSPLISPVSNSVLQETFSSIPDSSLVHSTYSEIGASSASTLPVYSMSNSISPIPIPVYPEDSLRITSSTLQSNPPSQSTVSAVSLFTTNVKTNSYVHNVPSALPTYTETNCLIPNVPPFSKVNDSYFKPSTSLPNVAETLAYPHNSELHLHCSSRFPSLQNSSKCNVPITNIPPIKTDNRRKRLPKEVLTISQLNESKPPNIDYVDNKLKQNTSIYSSKSKEYFQTKGNTALEIGNPKYQNKHLTNHSSPNSRSTDPRLGQPLFCVPPPFIRDLDLNKCLIVNLPVSPETLKELSYKKSMSKKIVQKRPIIRTIVNKSITKPNRSSACKTSQKNVEKAASLDTPKISATENVVFGASFPEVFSNANFADSVKSLNTAKKEKNLLASMNSHKNIADNITYERIPKTGHDLISFLETPNNIYTTTSLEANRVNANSTTLLVAPENITDDIGASLEAPQNATNVPPLLENSMKIADSVVSLNLTKNDVEVATFVQVPKMVPDALASFKTVEEDCEVIKSKTLLALNDSGITQNILNVMDNKQTKPKMTGRKRGRPPKNAKSSSTKNSNKNVQHNIPPVSKNIPPNSVHVITNNCYERVPPTSQSEISQRRYPATRNSTQPRVEPLKIVKDPKSKNCYTKVVKANSSAHIKTTPLPMPVPETYNFETDTLKKEVYNIKSLENGENEVEFETHLPLKKRKLSMPVPSLAVAQPTTLANVPRSRDKNEEISYPATPMLSIADVYMQPRTFKTPAEKKQLPPESSNTVPIRYEPPSVPESQFNCNLNSYAPAIYGFSKCPYSVKLDCNSYCPPPVLFPPEPFSRSN